MITIMPSGNLGNHLFQFAFGLSVAKKHHTEFVFNTAEIEKYFELAPYNHPIRKKIRLIRYMFSLKFNQYKNLDLSQDDAPGAIMNRVENNSVIYGYFQSELYFRSVEHAVRKNLSIKKELMQQFRSKFKSLFEKEIVCIGVRQTDYKTWRINEIGGQTAFIEIDYYKNIIQTIPDLDNKTLIFVSEDIATVKKELNYKGAYYMDNVTDCFLSLLVANTLIISNSSFLWWGAWLNQMPNKVVYAPKHWLGHKANREYPQNIIPAGWIQVQV